MRSLLALGILVIACGNSSSTPPPTQPEAQRAAGGCGVELFRTPACQRALDSACCPLEMECGKDPGCVQLLACIDGCKGKGDDCANGCGLKSRFAYCQTTCQGKDADCPTICAQKGGPAEPIVKFGLIAQCSKSIKYPADVRCSDGS